MGGASRKGEASLTYSRILLQGEGLVLVVEARRRDARERGVEGARRLFIGFLGFRASFAFPSRSLPRPDQSQQQQQWRAWKRGGRDANKIPAWARAAQRSLARRNFTDPKKQSSPPLLCDLQIKTKQLHASLRDVLICQRGVFLSFMHHRRASCPLGSFRAGVCAS